MIGEQTLSDEPARVSVAVVARTDDQLLLVRRGHGPAGGFWDLPAAEINIRTTLAETAVTALEVETGVEGVAGALIGVLESADDLDVDVRIVLEGHLLGEPHAEADGDVAEARWCELNDLETLRFRSGLAEFLYEHELI